jgi:hypothetical protein
MRHMTIAVRIMLICSTAIVGGGGINAMIKTAPPPATLMSQADLEEMLGPIGCGRVHQGWRER